jgi:hypothetical protein
MGRSGQCHGHLALLSAYLPQDRMEYEMEGKVVGTPRHVVVPQGFWCIRLDWQGCGVLSHARFSPCPTVPVETPGPGPGP